MKNFKVATSKASDWQSSSAELLTALGEIPEQANLAFIYATDQFAVELSRLIDELKKQTGIQHWVGSVGKGICSTDQEIYDTPAVTIMVASFPGNNFTVFSNMISAPKLAVEHHGFNIALVHADPRNGLVTEYINKLPEKIGNGYLVGGITSSDNHFYQVADDIHEGDISGIVFSESGFIHTGMTQGCTPIGEPHTLTECEHHLAMSIDDKPALRVFKEEIGEVLARDIDRAAGYIFAGFPIRGSDTGDYLVRDIVGIDPENEFLAIADNMTNGASIMFCKRDGQTATDDMYRMLSNIKKRTGETPIKGAIYISCVGRGRNLFGPNSEEVKIISEVLGEIPLVGFYANGEIAGNQLYGYTGVLTVFT